MNSGRSYACSAFSRASSAGRRSLVVLITSWRSASFVLYNAIGAGAWVCLCLGAGLLFGNVPVVKNNFSLVTIGIVFVSILPVIVEYVRQRR